MPESTCLHIQDQESGPIRVVDIPWISVRIGRAAFCEVRLSTDGLADEACRLYRRGRTWHLVPVGARGKIVVGGRSVDAACPLPYDVPFRIGPHYLTLRQDRTVDPDWQMHPGHVAAERKRSQPRPRVGRPELSEPAWAIPTVEPQRVVEASFRPDRHAQGTSKESLSGGAPAVGASVRDRWQTRWRAAGAELKARDERRKAGGESPKTGFGAGFESVPLKEATVPRTEPRRTAVPRETPVPTESPAARAPRDTPAAGATEAAPVVETPLVTPARDTDETISSVPPSQPLLAQAALPPRTEAPPEPDVPPAATAPLEVTPSEPAAVHEIPATTRALGSSEASETEAAQVEPDGLFDQIEPVPAGYTFAGEPDDFAGPFDIASPAPADDDASWYEIPIVAPAPEKRRNRQPSSTRKRSTRPRGLAEEKTVSSAAAKTRSRERSAALNAATLLGRTDDDPQPPLAPPVDPVSEPQPAPMPSAKDILATHEMRRKSLPPFTRAPRHAKALGPTLPREPDQWAVSAWIAGPPVAALVVALGVASVILSSWWAGDSRAVALVSQGLIAADQTGRRKPLPEGVAPPVASWASSTAQHLANWAVYMSLPEPGADPSPEDIDALAAQALTISPLNPTARLARAQLQSIASGSTIAPRELGLSRDAASLCWCARRLLAAGHKQEALNMYVRAIHVLIPAEPFRAALPRFCDDQNVPRYLLPGEDRRCEILREMLSKTEWEFADWSAAIPQDVTTTLAAARLLKEQGKREADVLLDRLADGPVPPESDKLARALALAARAEACAIKSRWKESEENYRLAIDLVDDDKIKRSWWFNLADIELRLSDETHWQTALRAALAVSPADEISRRATNLQRSNGGRSVSRATSARAN